MFFDLWLPKSNQLWAKTRHTLDKIPIEIGQFVLVLLCQQTNQPTKDT